MESSANTFGDSHPVHQKWMAIDLTESFWCRSLQSAHKFMTLLVLPIRVSALMLLSECTKSKEYTREARTINTLQALKPNVLACGSKPIKCYSTYQLNALLENEEVTNLPENLPPGSDISITAAKLQRQLSSTLGHATKVSQLLQGFCLYTWWVCRRQS